MPNHKERKVFLLIVEGSSDRIAIKGTLKEVLKALGYDALLDCEVYGTDLTLHPYQNNNQYSEPEDALENVVSGAVTYAVRRTKFQGRDIKKGDIIGLMDNDLCVVSETVEAAAEALLARMMEKKGEADAAVTLFYGEEVAQEDAEALLAKLEERYPEAECMIQSGGQSLYYYYLAVE